MRHDLSENNFKMGFNTDDRSTGASMNLFHLSKQLRRENKSLAPHAKPLHIDNANGRLHAPNSDIDGLTGSSTALNDTVFLVLNVKNGMEYVTTLTPGIVIYVTDTLMIYEMQTLNLVEIDDSPVLNSRREVISSHFASFAIENIEEIETIAKAIPLMKRLRLKVGKVYGIAMTVLVID